MCRVSRKFIKELPTMKLITESTLFVLLLCCCCCCLTVNAKCWVECPESQRNLSEPECFLKDDGKSSYCSKHIRSSDLSGQSISGYKFVSLSIDLTSKVQNLYIYNQIGSNLKIGAFRYHSEVRTLHVYYRDTYIRPDLFYLLPKISNLDLYQVKFRYFPHFSYSNQLLTYLRIRYFSFTYPGSYDSILRKGRVSGLSKLNRLELYPSQFLNTTDESFSGLTALTRLNLNRFHVPNPVATFSPLVKLHNLYYRYSELDDISFLSRTHSLFGLTHLSFHDNKITHIPTNLFSNYTKLYWLNLNFNKIASFEKDCFKTLRKLGQLHLHSNQLKELSTTAFRGLDSVNRIDLGRNSISHLSSRTFEYLKHLRYLHLYNLPLRCDCGLQWMSITGLTIYNSRCSTPPQHSNKYTTDPSIYVNCTQELSYQCFNRSNSCPTGSYCQDTLDRYTCVCEEEKHLFVTPLKKCVSYDKLKSCA